MDKIILKSINLLKEFLKAKAFDQVTTISLSLFRQTNDHLYISIVTTLFMNKYISLTNDQLKELLEPLQDINLKDYYYAMFAVYDEKKEIAIDIFQKQRWDFGLMDEKYPLISLVRDSSGIYYSM